MRVVFFSALAIVATMTSAFAETQMWVVTDRANRRTCPSTECGIVGQLFFRESANVQEVHSGWARVTQYYDAACNGGRSQYIDSGPSDCVDSNGIADGKFAEWIQLNLLSKIRPDDPGAAATGTAKLVSQSDDFRRYEDQFVLAAETLITSGQCKASDLADTGGFIKSTNKGPGIYFTYCDNGSDRIYLDVRTGDIFR